MNSKQRHEFNCKNLPNIYKLTDKEVVQNLVDKLIDALYIPFKGWDSVTQVDEIRLKHFGIGEEPINWGDLKCNEVKKFEDGSYLVIIDEASPSGCDTFCDYIQKYMQSYGWEVVCQTEW